MALRGILSNWVLAGGVIAGFGAMMLLGPNAPSVDRPSPSVDGAPEVDEDAAVDPPISEPEVLPTEPPETETETPESVSENLPEPPEAETLEDPPAPEVELAAVFPTELEICGSMSISNRPASVAGLDITNYQPTVSVNDVEIAVAPVEEACFSSGFGPRESSIHKGIDLHNNLPVQVYAAATGTVKEKQYRDDYGNMLVLDHGNGVYTRYAHLDSFADGLVFAETVQAGQPIGLMGNTASYSIPRHLHYELMTGEWGALSGSFGLTAINIMAQLPDN